MAIYKNDNGTWYVMIRYQDWTGAEMQTRIFYKKRSCGLGITIQITEESKRGYDNGKLLHYV
mgnify:FL=1